MHQKSITNNDATDIECLFSLALNPFVSIKVLPAGQVIGEVASTSYQFQLRSRLPLIYLHDDFGGGWRLGSAGGRRLDLRRWKLVRKVDRQPREPSDHVGHFRYFVVNIHNPSDHPSRWFLRFARGNGDVDLARPEAIEEPKLREIRPIVYSTTGLADAKASKGFYLGLPDNSLNAVKASARHIVEIQLLVGKVKDFVVHLATCQMEASSIAFENREVRLRRPVQIDA